MNLVLSACSKDEFDELPHSRWLVVGNREVKIFDKIVGVKIGKECSGTICKTKREAWSLFYKFINI